MSYVDLKKVALALRLVKIVAPSKAKVLLQVLEHIDTIPIAAPVAHSTTLVTAAPAAVVEEKGRGGVGERRRRTEEEEEKEEEEEEEEPGGGRFAR